MDKTNFYSDIRIGSWGFPFHIGCINFSWSIFVEDYDFDRPTEYGCETTGEKIWLIENQDEFAIFDLENEKYQNTSKPDYFYFPLSLAVGKLESMDLYKNVMNNKHLIIGYTKDKFYNVYQEFKDERHRMISFARLDMAEKYRDFLIRIPYSRYHTEDNMKIEELSL